MPKIDSYAFGRIVIDGRPYTSDLILWPDRVSASWWRKDGHRLRIEDLAEVLAEPPQVLVVGTGSMGRLRVPDETVRQLQAQGIQVVVALTPQAIEDYNGMQAHARTVAALHLTC